MSIGALVTLLGASVGLSCQAAAVFNCATYTAAAVLGLPDDILLPTLTAVRGIGPWTVDMFSMFHLGRPDILPVGDLAVRKVRRHS